MQTAPPLTVAPGSPYLDRVRNRAKKCCVRFSREGRLPEVSEFIADDDEFRLARDRLLADKVSQELGLRHRADSDAEVAKAIRRGVESFRRIEDSANDVFTDDGKVVSWHAWSVVHDGGGWFRPAKVRPVQRGRSRAARSGPRRSRGSRRATGCSSSRGDPPDVEPPGAADGHGTWEQLETEVTTAVAT